MSTRRGGGGGAEGGGGGSSEDELVMPWEIKRKNKVKGSGESVRASNDSSSKSGVSNSSSQSGVSRGTVSKAGSKGVVGNSKGAFVNGSNSKGAVVNGSKGTAAPRKAEGTKKEAFSQVCLPNPAPLALPPPLPCRHPCLALPPRLPCPRLALLAPAVSLRNRTLFSRCCSPCRARADRLSLFARCCSLDTILLRWWRFRGGLVFQAHRWLYHSTLGSRVIKKKKEAWPHSGLRLRF